MNDTASTSITAPIETSTPATAVAEVWFYRPDDPNRWHKTYHKGTLTLAGSQLSLRDENSQLVWQVEVAEVVSVRIIGTAATFRFRSGTKFDVDFRDVRAATRRLGPRGSPAFLIGTGPALDAMKPFVAVFKQHNLIKRVSWVIPTAFFLAIIILSVIVGIVMS